MTTTRLNSTAAIGSSAGTADAIRHETEDGTDYLVADTVAIKEGVYSYPDGNGNIIREYLSESEIEESADDWTGQPVVLPTHPLDEDGNPTTFSRGNVAQAPPTVGETRNPMVAYDADGTAKLQFETWLDLSNEGSHDGDFDSVVTRLEAGDTVENSTGYDAGSRANGSVYDGKSYQREQVGLEPDHHAILLNEQGNCSESDGCGVGRANSNSATDAAQYHVMTEADSGTQGDLSDEAAASVGRRVLNSLPGILGGTSEDEDCECHTETATANNSPEETADDNDGGESEGEQDDDSDNESDSTMTDDSLIDQLRTADSVPYSATTLEAMNDSELDAVKTNYVETESPEPSDHTGDDDGDDDVEPQDEDDSPEDGGESDAESDRIQELEAELEEVREKVEAPEQEAIAEAEKAVANSQGISEDAVSITSVDEAEKVLADQQTPQHGQPQQQVGNMAGVPQQTTRANTSGDEEFEFDDYSSHQQED